MQVRSMRDLSALVKNARLGQSLTQAELADRLGVSRDWVVRLEQAGPRLEVQKVLDALVTLGLHLDVHEATPSPTKPRASPKARPSSASSEGRPANDDPFAFLTEKR